MTSKGAFQPKAFYDSMTLCNDFWRATLKQEQSTEIQNTFAHPITQITSKNCRTTGYYYKC